MLKGNRAIFLSTNVTFIKKKKRAREKGDFCCWLYQTSWYQTNYPTENNYKSWKTHIQQLLKGTREKPKQSGLEKLKIPERLENVLKRTLSSLLLLLGTFVNFLQVKGWTAWSHTKIEFGAIKKSELEWPRSLRKESHRAQHPVHTVLTPHFWDGKPNMQHKTHWNQTASSY